MMLPSYPHDADARPSDAPSQTVPRGGRREPNDSSSTLGCLHSTPGVREPATILLGGSGRLVQAVVEQVLYASDAGESHGAYDAREIDIATGGSWQTMTVRRLCAAGRTFTRKQGQRLLEV